MAALALGVVGGIIGSFIPGVGTSLGFALGPLAGDLVHAPVVTIEAPQDEETQE